MTSVHATLYTRPGCHLCEQAQAELERLAPRQAHTLTVVLVNGDAELERRFGERIPVLVVGGRQYDAPLPRATLERALREAAAAAQASPTTPGTTERDGG